MNVAFLPRIAAFFCAAIGLSSCVSAPSSRAPVVTAIAPPPQPLPRAPASHSIAENWQDWPISDGDWSFAPVDGGSIARFGPTGQPPLLTFRCERASHRILVARLTTAKADQIAGQMRVLNSYDDVRWPVLPGRAPGTSCLYVVAARPASDVTFDDIAFSRGRFAIEATGAAPIAAPNWPEVARVIEDCR